MATVGQISKGITKRAFESSPDRQSVVDGLIQLSVEQVYKKTSRDIGAERMIVAERRAVPSDVGIKFYISTAHIKASTTMVVSGIHIIPFEKTYVVGFLMVSPLDRAAAADNEIMSRAC